MKHLFSKFASAIILALLFAACQPSKEKSEKMESSEAQDSTKMEMASVVYTCSMHPEVETHEPGKCPKCGMDLVKKEVNDSTKSDMMK